MNVSIAYCWEEKHFYYLVHVMVERVDACVHVRVHVMYLLVEHVDACVFLTFEPCGWVD